MTGIELAYLSGGKHFYRIDVIAKTSGLADIGKGPSRKYGIPGKEQHAAKLIDADGA